MVVVVKESALVSVILSLIMHVWVKSHQMSDDEVVASDVTLRYLFI